MAHADAPMLPGLERGTPSQRGCRLKTPDRHQSRNDILLWSLPYSTYRRVSWQLADLTKVLQEVDPALESVHTVLLIESRRCDEEGEHRLSLWMSIWRYFTWLFFPSQRFKQA